MALAKPPGELPKLTIVSIQPNVDGGRYPVKRVVGDLLTVHAVILKGGYETLGAELRVRRRGSRKWQSVAMDYSYNDDRWEASVALDEIGRWEYTVAAWTDWFASWRTEIERKHAAGRDLASELLEGRALLESYLPAASKGDRAVLEKAIQSIAGSPQSAAVATALDASLLAAVRRSDPRIDLVTQDPPLALLVERKRARYGAWYELFPRSQSPEPGKHGTLRDVELQLPRLKDLGFNVIYLPPIHPIGEVNRKGKNNSLVAQPGDLGSPWAIGSQHGGHDAIHPQLGTMDDLDHLVAAAAEHGMEIALDFAVQCAPDHPYVREHPEWFRQRPDGSIKYAENPPKRYEDIVALDLWCADYRKLWAELLRVVLQWVEHGIRIFRVDNPHTKPIAFWEWLIAEVKSKYPDVLFLAEAFTRPNLLHQLAKIGFTQGYSYFTWRNTRPELEEYGLELTQGPGVDYLQPNFFANTPDILHEYLQQGGRPAFKVRYALAAVLSTSCGIYSGFELCESTPLHEGSEEYLDSEKYEIRQRDWDAEGNINAFIRAVNHARDENPALHEFRNLHFHQPDNPQVLACSKATADGTNRVLAVVNLDPHTIQEATVYLDGEPLGLRHDSTYIAHDLVTGQRYNWQGLANYVRLDPAIEPVHLFRIEEPQ